MDLGEEGCALYGGEQDSIWKAALLPQRFSMNSATLLIKYFKARQIGNTQLYTW